MTFIPGVWTSVSSDRRNCVARSYWSIWDGKLVRINIFTSAFLGEANPPAHSFAFHAICRRSPDRHRSLRCVEFGFRRSARTHVTLLRMRLSGYTAMKALLMRMQVIYRTTWDDRTLYICMTLGTIPFVLVRRFWHRPCKFVQWHVLGSSTPGNRVQ